MQNISIVKTPVGPIEIKNSDTELQSIRFLPSSIKEKIVKHSLTHEIIDQIRCYFDDPSYEFNLPLQISGTNFQKQVWQALTKIPTGQTLSYGDLAKKLKTAPRAIGNGCRTNPLPIVIPCHRIVSQQGLGGFNGAQTGAWPKIKKWLLDHEQSRTSSSSKPMNNLLRFMQDPDLD